MSFLEKIEKILPFAFCVYLALIGIALGGIIVLGALVAPVIFYTGNLLATPLSQYDSGILMAQIFVKFNFILNTLAFFILVFEILNYRLTQAKVAPLLGCISIILIFIFTLFQTPFILKAQKEGVEAIQSEQFAAIHGQSELLFKVLFVVLLGLFCVHIYRFFKKTKS